MNRVVVMASSIFVIFILAACSSPTSLESTPSPTDTPASPPEEDKATVIGRVLSAVDGEPLPDTIVRLAEVYRQGDEAAFALDEAQSPGDITDGNGKFIMENIPAREYVIIVGDVKTIHEIIAEPDGKGKVIDPAAGEITDLGDLEVNLE